jgi:hypothetical protein
VFLCITQLLYIYHALIPNKANPTIDNIWVYALLLSNAGASGGPLQSMSTLDARIGKPMRLHECEYKLTPLQEVFSVAYMAVQTLTSFPDILAINQKRYAPIHHYDNNFLPESR